MVKSLTSFVLVAIQFILIIAIAWFCTVIGDVYSITLMILGILLGVWAIGAFRIRVNIFPDIVEGQSLIMNGPYKYIRHPMYTSVLIVTFAWVLNRIDLISITLWVLLAVNLIIKLNYEERLLLEHFDSYKDYVKKTKRLIPFVF
jgi:protein-S-isoprenylcysteine O-methyltransferase Ste14